MKVSKNVFLFIIVLILLFLIFSQINYLTLNNYIIECFTNIMEESDKTSHTVNLPLTSTTSCQNFCGPTARCAKTGQQCSADIDCPGCQPYSPELKPTDPDSIVGDDAAGKLTWGMTPQYSSLTSGYGTKSALYVNDKFGKAPQPNWMENTWIKQFNEERKMFNAKFKPPANYSNLPKYPKRFSPTGEFIEDGPLASNSYL